MILLLTGVHSIRLLATSGINIKATPPWWASLSPTCSTVSPVVSLVCPAPVHLPSLILRCWSYTPYLPCYLYCSTWCVHSSLLPLWWTLVLQVVLSAAGLPCKLSPSNITILSVSCPPIATSPPSLFGFAFRMFLVSVMMIFNLENPSCRYGWEIHSILVPLLLRSFLLRFFASC